MQRGIDKMECQPEKIPGSQANGTRLYFVDLLESIAIFLVLVYHGTNYDFNFLQGQGNIVLFSRYFLRTIQACCVPLFFFVNGYLLLNRPFCLKKHIMKMIRLILLTIIWGVINLSVLMVLKNEYFSVRNFLVAVGTCKRGWINFLWFMQALFVIYCCFPLIKTVYDNRRDIFYFFTFIAAFFTFGNAAVNLSATIAAYLLSGKIIDFTDFNWFGDFNPFRGIYGYAFVYFCIGGMADEITGRLKFLKKTSLDIALILLSMSGLFAVGISLSYILNKSWDVVWYGYDTVFTIINVVCLFSLCSKYEGKENLFRKAVYIVSSNTLGIYFVHEMFNKMLLPHVKQCVFISNIPGNIIYALILLAVSLGTVLVIRKIPLLKRLVM